MKVSLKALIPLLLFVILLVGFFVGTRLNPHKLDSMLIDKPVPAFQLESLYPDRPAVSTEDFKGKITLLNVFGSWCVACKLEHPYLVELKAEENINLVGLDWRDKRDVALRWLETNGDPYDEIAFDEHSEVAIDLGVTGAPETYLIDPDGIVRVKYIGPMTEEVWRQKFLPAIGKMERSE